MITSSFFIRDQLADIARSWRHKSRRRTEPAADKLTLHNWPQEVYKICVSDDIAKHGWTWMAGDTKPPASQGNLSVLGRILKNFRLPFPFPQSLAEWFSQFVSRKEMPSQLCRNQIQAPKGGLTANKAC